MPPPVPTATKSGLRVGKSLPTVGPEPSKPKPTQVKASLGKYGFHPARPDSPILPRKLTCVFKKHKCNNSATFPVYKPPTTLPGMVSGLGQKEKKHAARWTKAVFNYLQILKTVDHERERWILARERAEEHEEALSSIFSATATAGVGQTHRRGVCS